MIQQTLDFDADVIQAIISDIDKYPRELGRVIKANERRFTQRLQEIFAASEPSPVTASPYVWSRDKASNDKARRWYFANKVPKGSKGGHYQRTGKLLKSYGIQVNVLRDENNIIVTNFANAEMYVLGERQIYGHERTGWPKRDDIIANYAIEFQDALVDIWITVIDGLG